MGEHSTHPAHRISSQDATKQLSAEQMARILRTVQAKYEMRILRAEGVRSEFMELVADVALLADMMATLFENQLVE